MKDEPRIPDAPPHLQHLLRRCLDRDPRQRLQAIGEARILLQEAVPELTAKTQSRKEESRFPFASLRLGGEIFLALALLALLYFREKPPETPVVSRSIPSWKRPPPPPSRSCRTGPRGRSGDALGWRPPRSLRKSSPSSALAAWARSSVPATPSAWPASDSSTVELGDVGVMEYVPGKTLKGPEVRRCGAQLAAAAYCCDPRRGDSRYCCVYVARAGQGQARKQAGGARLVTNFG